MIQGVRMFGSVIFESLKIVFFATSLSVEKVLETRIFLQTSFNSFSSYKKIIVYLSNILFSEINNSRRRKRISFVKHNKFNPIELMARKKYEARIYEIFIFTKFYENSIIYAMTSIERLKRNSRYKKQIKIFKFC